ncbi:MAG: ImmA/IrrE family metallo-endopeptidase [Candidatus Levyibacteriota bacterium]
MIYNNIDLTPIKLKAEAIIKRYYRYSVPPIISNKAVQGEGFNVGIKHFSDSKVAELVRATKTIFLTDDKELIKLWGNFAIAHEMGHYYFDDRPIDAFYTSTLTNDKCDDEDKVANYFAVSLLLPDTLMHEWSWLDEGVFKSAFKIPQEGLTLKRQLS